MPVWHARTKAWRESGQLAVVGIAQEQHADRCALFAQWQGLDWPILWDPFNLTGASAVPNVYALDEHGVVRLVRPDPRTFEADFLERDFAPPTGPAPNPPPVTRAAATSSPTVEPEAELARVLAAALWRAPDSLDQVLEALAALAHESDAPPAAAFRLGVALRLRHDSPRGRPGDFQAALEAWSAALARDPDQYVWRRRLQQYGPRLDKPYPFYGWIERASAELIARGEQPVAVRAALSGAEVAAAARAFEALDTAVEPDPQGRIRRDTQGWLAFESAVTFDTSPPGRGGGGARAGRVHLLFRPRAEVDAHWNNSAEPPRAWISAPPGWRVERRLVERPLPASEVSAEERVFDFEVLPPEGARETGRLTGYLLFHACEGLDGRCVLLRRDFAVEVAPPGR